MRKNVTVPSTRQAMLIASVVPPLISPALAGSPLVRATKIVATVSPRLLLDAAAGFLLPPLPQPPGGALQGLDTAKKGSATGSGLYCTVP